jgi:Ca2+:H+ antiporter
MAHRVGQPFGALALALAVIEVALIVSVMLTGKTGSETLVLPNRPDHYRPV